MPSLDRVEQPVGDRAIGARHRDRERVGRLVGGVVVAGEPARRAVRLAEGDGPVVGPDPADAVDRTRPSVIGDRHREWCSAGIGALGVTVISPPRRETAALAPSTVTELTAQPSEVEVERAQRLGRRRVDRRDRLDPVDLRAGPESQVVVVDLVAAVAGQREVRIAGSGRARGLRMSHGGGEQRRRQRDGGASPLAPLAQRAPAARRVRRSRPGRASARRAAGSRPRSPPSGV